MSLPYYVFPPPTATGAKLKHDTGGWELDSHPGVHPTGRAGFVFDIPDNTPDGNGAALTFLQNTREIITLRGIFYLRMPTGVGLEVDDFTAVKGGSSGRQGMT